MGYFGLDGVHALEDVAEVAVAEVLAVGRGEFFTLAEAAARVGIEDEVALVGPQGFGAGAGGGGGAAVDVDDERVLFGGVVVLGEGEPALDVEAFVLPLDGLEARRVELGGVVDVGELGGLAGSADVDLGRLVVGGQDVGDEAVRGAGDGVLDGAAAADRDLAEVVGGVGDDGVLVGVGVGEQGVAAAVFDEADGVVVEPDLPGGCAVDAGGDVGGCALPLALTIQMSPPVEPWSDMRPPMKAMRLPSGE